MWPSAKHGRGKRWVARWRDDTGQQKSASFDKKTPAEHHLTDVQAQLNRGAYIDPAGGKLQFGALAAQWLDSQTFDLPTREVTERRLRLHVVPAVGATTEIRRIKPSVVRAAIKRMQDGLSDGAVYIAVGNLSQILQTAVDDELISKNPCHARSVIRPQAPERKVVAWPLDRVEGTHSAMMTRVIAPYKGRRDVDLACRSAELMTAGGGLGLRQGEAFALSPDDVDWLRGVVHVVRQVRIVGSRMCFAPPKRGKTRDVPLPESVSLRFAAHLERFPAREVTLPWKKPDGKPVTAKLMFTTVGGR